MMDHLRDRTRHAVITGARVTGASRAVSLAVAARPARPVDDHVTVRCWRGIGERDPVALVAHYDEHPGAGEAFRYLCAGLRAAGLRVIVISTSPHPDTVADALSDVADAVLTRDNVGFDFLSWARGLAALQDAAVNPRQLVLTNGSMYGPVAPLEPLLERMRPVPVWGMTESLDFSRHLQSWWLGFDGVTAASPRFRRYWRGIQPATNKWTTILAHELTWARRLAPRGTDAVAVMSVADHGCRRNPLFFAWPELIAGGVPFVKRSLFTHNYDRVDLSGWRDRLAQVAPAFDVGIIERDLARSAFPVS